MRLPADAPAAHKHLFVLQPRTMPHIILHHRVAALKGVLGLQPVPDSGLAVCRFLLLPAASESSTGILIDDSQPKVPALAAPPASCTFIAWRQGKTASSSGWTYAIAQTRARRLPDAHAVHLHASRLTPCIHFHLVHLPVSHKTQLPCYVLELKVWWSTFRPPQKRRSRGVLWSIIAPRRLCANQSCPRHCWRAITNPAA